MTTSIEDVLEELEQEKDKVAELRKHMDKLTADLVEFEALKKQVTRPSFFSARLLLLSAIVSCRERRTVQLPRYLVLSSQKVVCRTLYRNHDGCAKLDLQFTAWFLLG